MEQMVRACGHPRHASTDRRLRGNAALCPSRPHGRSRPSSQAMGGAPRSGTASDTEQAACRRSNTIDLCYRILDMFNYYPEYA